MIFDLVIFIMCCCSFISYRFINEWQIVIELLTLDGVLECYCNRFMNEWQIVIEL